MNEIHHAVAVEIAAEFNAFLTEFRDSANYSSAMARNLELQVRYEAAAIAAFATVRAATIAAEAQQLGQFASTLESLDDGSPDDADVMEYDLGASVLLKNTRGKVVLISDEHDDGKLTVKWARDIDGKNTIHTVVMSDEGIAE